MSDVADSSALIARLRKEPGWDVVEALFLQSQGDLFAHAVNVCEVFYEVYRQLGEQLALDTVARLVTDGLVIRYDMDDAFWQDIGRLKATVKRVSLADCFALALARRLGAELVTADHHEFDPIVPLGLCRIRFIR